LQINAAERQDTEYNMHTKGQRNSDKQKIGQWQCHTAKNKSWRPPWARNSLLVNLERLSSINVPSSHSPRKCRTSWVHSDFQQMQKGTSMTCMAR